MTNATIRTRHSPGSGGVSHWTSHKSSQVQHSPGSIGHNTGLLKSPYIRALAAGDRQGCSLLDYCLVAYSTVGLLGLSHTRFSEGLLPSGGDLQSCVSGDDAVLDARLGVERQTGALEEAEGGRGALNYGVVLTLKCYGCRGGRNSKGFWPLLAFRVQISTPKPFTHVPPYSLEHRRLLGTNDLQLVSYTHLHIRQISSKCVQLTPNTLPDAVVETGHTGKATALYWYSMSPILTGEAEI